MRIIVMTFLLAASLSVQSGVADAGENWNSKIVIHLLSSTTSDACTRNGTRPNCMSIISSGSLLPDVYYAYLLVVDASAVAGIAGVQCGIAYDGVAGSGIDIYSWNLCADAESLSTGWPAAGGGNRITWNPETNCQRYIPPGNDPDYGAIANAGYFYLAAYTPDHLIVTTRPVDGIASVTDCSGITEIIEGGDVVNMPSHLGAAAFAGSGIIDPGYNPCGIFTCGHCIIQGDSSIVEGTTAHVYRTAAQPGGPWNNEWTVSGNATISGPSDGWSVTVSAGAPGAFVLRFESRGWYESCLVCQRTIPVSEQVATIRSTWSSIKALHH